MTYKKAYFTLFSSMTDIIKILENLEKGIRTIKNSQIALENLIINSHLKEQ